MIIYKLWELIEINENNRLTRISGHKHILTNIDKNTFTNHEIKLSFIGG